MDDTPSTPMRPTAMESEIVRFKLVTNGEIESDRILQGLQRMPGVTNPQVDTLNSRLTFEYTGDLQDLPAIERALTNRSMRVFTISPARVVMSVSRASRDATPQTLQNAFYAQGARLANVTASSAEVYVDLESVCVCALASGARDNGYEAVPQSHLDITVTLTGDGDMQAFLRAVREIDSVINVACPPDRDAVGILSAGRLTRRQIERIAEQAGYGVESIEGT